MKRSVCFLILMLVLIGASANARPIEILKFNTKLTNQGFDEYIVVSCLVKVLNPEKKSLQVCVDFLDKDEFTIEQFCRSMLFSGKYFKQKGDTTVFKCKRTFKGSGWTSSEVGVSILK